MDAVATYGVAARIREAGGRDGKVSADLARQADLDWLDRLLAWQPLAAPGDFLDGLRADLSHARHRRVHPGRRPGEAARRLDRGRLRLRGLPGHRRQRRRRPGQRDAQADGEPPGARPGRRPDHRALRRPARVLAGRRPQRPGQDAPEGGHRPPQGRGRRRRAAGPRWPGAVAADGARCATWKTTAPPSARPAASATPTSTRSTRRSAAATRTWPRSSRP